MIEGNYSKKRGLRRAAAYVRASTDHQQYSIENQLQAITDYALAHDFQVVRTYSDAGRSGLTVHGRDALQQLVADVEGRRADFDLILVYDVSRWGRFQNVDESAFFEFICKKAGVAIEYCAEGFQNDGSIVAAITKVLKRAMAAEYSRELSVKVARSQTRLAKMGYHQGGPAGFGLRRLMVDRNGSPKGLLADGEQKSLQTDRVLLVPGPMSEIQTVRRIFKMYVHGRLSSRRIAKRLNRNGMRNGRGNPWTYHNVEHLLRSEKYAGNFVYNRTSLKLQTKRISNPKPQWVRCVGAIKSVVEAELFASAQKILERGRRVSNNDLLNHLTAVWCVTGRLSCKSMRSVPNTPPAGTYRQHFGSLQNAYHVLGYRRTHTYRNEAVGDFLHHIHRNVASQVMSAIEQQGGHPRIDSKSLLQIDDSVTVSLIVLPFTNRHPHGPCWRHYKCAAPSDLVFIVRLKKSNKKVLDYHLFPFHLVHGPTFNFTDENLAPLLRYRFGSPSEFYSVFRKSMGMG